MNIVSIDSVESFMALEHQMASAKLGAIDIEDTGALEAEPRLVSTAITLDGETAYVLHAAAHAGPEWKGPLFEPWQIEKMRRRLQSVPWIMHNGYHDRLMMRKFGIDLRLKHDTMAMAYLLNQTDPSAKNARKGLEFLAQQMLGAEEYKDVDYKNILDEPWEKIATMNGRDAIYTYRLYRPLADQLNASPALSRIYQWLLMPAVNELIHVTENGVPVDLPRLEALTATLQEEFESVRVWLNQHTPEPLEEAYPKGWPKPKGKGQLPTFNPGSFKQVGHVLYDVLGLPCPKVNEETGNRSTDEDTLTQIAVHHPLPWIDKLLEYRGVKKKLEYCEMWPSLWDEAGVLHPRYKPLHVVTGRLSSEKPNIQNVPRDKRFRNVFGGVEGYSWVKADYSQIELRIAAWLAREELMLAAYHKQEDIHAITARAVLGIKDVTAEYRPGTTGRDVGKIINFGLLYGAGPVTLARQARMEYGVHMSVEEAKSHRAAWFNFYPAFKAWHARMRSDVVADRVAISPIGRVRQLPEARFWSFEDEDLKKKAAKAVREGINHPVQSFASDLLLMNVVRVAPIVKRFEGKMICEVHDEMDFLIPTDAVKEFAVEARDTMEDVSWLERFGIKLGVPVVAEITSGTHWGTQEAVL